MVDRVINRADRRQRLRDAARTASWDFKSKGSDTIALINASSHAQSWGRCIDAVFNSYFAVLVYQRETEWGQMIHLAIRRHTAGTDISWADKQRIKTALAGKERVAIEVYPAQSELTDAANMYHLWVLPEGMALPFDLGREP